MSKPTELYNEMIGVIDKEIDKENKNIAKQRKTTKKVTKK